MAHFGTPPTYNFISTLSFVVMLLYMAMPKLECIQDRTRLE